MKKHDNLTLTDISTRTLTKAKSATLAEMEASQVIIAGSVWLLDGSVLVVSTERTTSASQHIRVYSGLDDASGAPTTETVELQRLQLVDGVPYKQLRNHGSDGIPLMMEVVLRH